MKWKGSNCYISFISFIIWFLAFTAPYFLFFSLFVWLLIMIMSNIIPVQSSSFQPSLYLSIISLSNNAAAGDDGATICVCLNTEPNHQLSVSFQSNTSVQWHEIFFWTENILEQKIQPNPINFIDRNSLFLN